MSVVFLLRPPTALLFSFLQQTLKHNIRTLSLFVLVFFCLLKFFYLSIRDRDVLLNPFRSYTYTLSHTCLLVYGSPGGGRGSTRSLVSSCFCFSVLVPEGVNEQDVMFG